MKNLFLIVILSFSFISLSHAGGPWPQAKGKGYFKLSEWWTVFDQHYTDTGQIDPNVTTGVFNTNFYGEYGLTDRLTVITNANFFSRNVMNNLRSATTNEILVEGEGLNSIGDVDLAFKYGVTAPGAKIPIAVSATFGIPLGKTASGALGNLQTGDGEFNQMLQVDAGTGFNLGKTSAYISTYLGVNNRSKGFSEELRYGLELGFGLLSRKLWMSLRMNAVNSFKNGDTAATVTSTSIFANNTEFTSLGIEANYYITQKLGLSVGSATALRGEIIAAAPSFSVGVFYDMK